ncbi:DUF6646 family protein [Flavobacterium ardleyense]|uniref:DUF6646 family protein n=1 Tax=Flavobacterium ardleyense TaxID=2038737 RepID=A0ABW5Z786_9FLAO
MKNFFTVLGFLIFTTTFSQVYDGFADIKKSFGASFQDKGIGIVGNYDTGLSDYFSYGVSFGLIVKNSYPKSIIAYDQFNQPYELDSQPENKLMEIIDFNARLNLHMNKLLNLGDNFDLYAGANAGRNFGGQAGTRYLITEGFGFFAEVNVPFVTNIINLNDDAENFYKFYEQPVLSVGIVISN